MRLTAGRDPAYIRLRRRICSRRASTGAGSGRRHGDPWRPGPYHGLRIGVRQCHRGIDGLRGAHRADDVTLHLCLRLRGSNVGAVNPHRSAYALCIEVPSQKLGWMLEGRGGRCHTPPPGTSVAWGSTHPLAAHRGSVWSPSAGET